MPAFAVGAFGRLGVEQESIRRLELRRLVEIAWAHDAHRLDRRNQRMLARKRRHLPRRLLAMQLHRADLGRLADQLVEKGHSHGRDHPRLGAKFGCAADQGLRLLEGNEAGAGLDHHHADHVGAGLDGHLDIGLAGQPADLHADHARLRNQTKPKVRNSRAKSRNRKGGRGGRPFRTLHNSTKVAQIPQRPFASKSRMSVSSFSCVVGSGGVGASAFFFRRLFIALTTMNIAKATMVKVMTKLMKAP